MDMETENIKEDVKPMEDVTFNEEPNVLEDNLPDQYDIVELVDIQPMDQDLEQYHIKEEDEQAPNQDIITSTEAHCDESGLHDEQEPESEVAISEIEEKPKIVQNPTSARTIAPKPVAPKIIGGSSGRQILLIQSPNTQTGQTIRLVSGNSTSSSTGSYQLVKRPDGVMQLRQAPSKVVTATKKIAPAPANAAKNVLTKVTVKANNQHMVIGTPSTETTSTIKILPMANTTGNACIKVASPTKTITFAQAQNMGLIRSNNTKMQVVSTIGKMGIKAPMKILPAPAHGITPIKTGVNQNILIKQAGLRPVGKQTLLAAKPATGTPSVPMSTTLIKTVKPNVQVPAAKPAANSTPTTASTQVIKIQTSQNTSGGQIHQINVPGHGVQYVRLMSNTSTSGSVTQVSRPNATFTTRAVLKTTSGIKPIKNSIVSIRPAVIGTKTIVTSNPPIVKTTTKLPATIMTTKQDVTSSSTGPTASSSIPKTVQAALPKTNKVQNNHIVISGKNSSNIMISPSQLSQIRGATVVPTGNNMQQLVVIPAQYMHQMQQKNNANQDEGNLESLMDVDIDDPIVERMPSIGRPSVKYKQEIKRELSLENLTLLDKRAKDVVEANGIRPRKPCNCTRSQCLKLYCDCFANGEFCNMCNCKDCMNNIENEGERQKAIRSCLDRNPSAFRPKIGKAKDPGLEAIRRHNKGCNCKRSGCLKNYCECFEAKIACSNNCKCIGCRNIEDCLERKRGWADDMDGLSNKKFASGEDDLGWSLGRDLMGNNKWPINFITPDVIEATCQCLLAQADEAIKSGPNDDKVIDEILEEFGRCLVQIIECFNKSNEGQSEESS